ncbi:MAG: DUF2252 family protein [Myxococcales bacterium]|nr:DUF2252 family protein [Myxococcales bacterium]
MQLHRQTGGTASAHLLVMTTVAMVAWIALSTLGSSVGTTIADASKGSPSTTDTATAPPSPAGTTQAASGGAFNRAIRHANRSLATSSPRLVAEQAAKMAEDPFLYYRGTTAGYLRDWTSGRASKTDFPSDARVLSPGDAHADNFGLLRGDDGVFRFEINDFDSVGFYPYLWDPRRLMTSLALSHDRSPEQLRTILESAARGYLRELTDPGTVDLTLTASDADALLSRGRWGPRKYLREDGLGLVRGPDRKGSHVLEDLPPQARGELPRALEGYVRGLDGRAGLSLGPVIDAARIYGKGVSSLPIRRALVLVEDANLGPLVLEFKELTERISMNHFRAPAPDVPFGTDVLGRIHGNWVHRESGADWGLTHWQGDPYLVRVLFPGQRGVKSSRWKKASDDALARIAAIMGGTLGRIHHQNGDLVRDLAHLSEGETQRFVDEQIRFALDYAERIEKQWDRW